MNINFISHLSQVLTQYQDNLIYVYETYMNTVCDVIAVNGFAKLVKSVEMPPKITACFADRLPSRKTSSELVITCAFSQPLTHIAVYKVKFRSFLRVLSSKFNSFFVIISFKSCLIFTSVVV